MMWLEITHRLISWLHKHGIETQGVKITLTFPDRTSRYAAEAAYKYDLDGQAVYYDPHYRERTMNGLVIEFASKNDPRHL